MSTWAQICKLNYTARHSNIAVELFNAAGIAPENIMFLLHQIRGYTDARFQIGVRRVSSREAKILADKQAITGPDRRRFSSTRHCN